MVDHFNNWFTLALLCFSTTMAQYADYVNHQDPRLGEVIDAINDCWENNGQECLGQMLENEVGSYFEGDILEPELDQPIQMRNGILNENARWVDGIVPYKIADYAFTVKGLTMIYSAMNDYHMYTCIRFVRKTDEHDDYVLITSENAGCFSQRVGKSLTGGMQKMNLQFPGCLRLKGTCIHELMHVLGFWHEQSRYDRNDHIRVEYDNIDRARWSQFTTVSSNRSTFYDLPYDMASVMHYSAKAFSRNGQYTIKPRDEDEDGSVMGNRRHFSEIDKKKINTMYQCTEFL